MSIEAFGAFFVKHWFSPSMALRCRKVPTLNLHQAVWRRKVASTSLATFQFAIATYSIPQLSLLHYLRPSFTAVQSPLFPTHQNPLSLSLSSWRVQCYLLRTAQWFSTQITRNCLVHDSKLNLTVWVDFFCNFYDTSFIRFDQSVHSTKGVT